MNVAIVAHNLVRGDGQGRINFEIARRAAQLGHHVTLIANKVAPELAGDRIRLFTITTRIQKPNLLKVGSFRRQADRLVRTMRDEFDVIVGNGYVLTEPHDVNLCQFVHGAWARSPVHVARLHRGPYAWYQWLYTSRNSVGEKVAYGASEIVVAPSKKIVDDLCSIGVPRHKTRVLYNGVDPDEFVPDRVDRAEVGLPSAGTPMGVFVGDIRTPRKNLDSVLKALASTPGVHLAVVGELHQSPFPTLARELNIQDRVHFLGYRRDVDRIMRSCDFFVFPSRYEAGALVILEALACGLPVITAASAGGAELVSQEAGVILEDSEDINGLSAAMTRLIADPALRARQSAAARAIAEAHSWRRMADDYLALFEECRR